MVALVDFGSGRGAASRTHERLSLIGEDDARSDASSPTPDGRSNQLPPPDGCSTRGAVNSAWPNGVRREKRLRTSVAGLPNGRRDWHSNPSDRTGNEGLEHPVHPARAACRELHQIRSGSAFPLERQNVQPRLEGEAPGFYGGKRWQSLNTQLLSPAPWALGRACKPPWEKCAVFFNTVRQMFTDGTNRRLPVSVATGRRRGSSAPGPAVRPGPAFAWFRPRLSGASPSGCSGSGH